MCRLRVLAVFLLMASVRAGGEFIREDQWYARMREPWKPEAGGFLREWLIVGEFPNPPPDEPSTGGEGRSCAGCDIDYLREHGGEGKIKPLEGMTHLRPDGSTATWHRVRAAQDTIDFAEALPGRPHENAVAYAYATVPRKERGPVLLALGSDDGVLVWVNGKLVHRHIVGRAVVADSDVVAVNLEAGENSILLKVEQGSYAWGFCCRLLDDAVTQVLPRKEFNPALASPMNATSLVVRSDSIEEAGRTVSVEVIRAGGGVVEAARVERGRTAQFDTSGWPDGAYEVRCAIAFPFGDVKYRHLPWYRGDAAAAVQRLRSAAGKADPRSPYGFTAAMLAELVADRLGGPTNAVPDDRIAAVHSPLLEFEELELERAGAGGRVRPFGFVRLAYRDAVDDAPQFCRAYLPPGYDPARRWPMVIYLHGYNPENPRYVRWWAVDQRHQPRCEDMGAIYLEPHGRGDSGYEGIGDRDVTRCIELAKSAFAVDEDRVYLTGESMGGGGTWAVGTRHPELFAAIAPIYGGGDYRAQMEDEAYDRLTPLRRFQQEAWSSTVQAESLLTTPVLVNHGDADSIVEVDWSRFMVRELQRWGYDIRYVEKPGGGHFGDTHWPGIMAWLPQHIRQAHPRHVRVRAAALRDAAAHWTRVLQSESPFELIRVDAEVVAPNVVRVDSTNVLCLSLSPAGPLADPAQPLAVVWNGRKMPAEPWRDGAVTIRSEAAAPGALAKRPELAGPIQDVMVTPFAVVQGTISTDAMMRAHCERRARALVNEWEDWQKHTPRFFKDRDLSDADAATYSLLLIGGPDDNAVTRRLADRLPLRIAGAEVTLDGHTFHAPDAAVRMVYPSPLNRERYVEVEAGTSAAGMYHVGRAPTEFDFCIHDGRREDEKEGRPLEKVAIALGSFDAAWRVADRFLLRGDPDARARSPARAVPRYVDDRGLGATLHLGDLLEEKAVNCFRYLERDTNGRGEPIRLGGRTYARGLAVYPWSIPGSAEWNVDGGGWQTLRGTIGLECGDLAKLSEKDRANVKVRFTVLGDEKELFRSEPFGMESSPQEISVPVAGVKTLRLVVHNEAPWSEAPKSANWADLRLDR